MSGLYLDLHYVPKFTVRGSHPSCTYYMELTLYLGLHYGTSYFHSASTVELTLYLDLGFGTYLYLNLRHGTLIMCTYSTELNCSWT
jgi:hypothetical protein